MPNQPEQAISNNQCSNGSDVTKGYKNIESNVQTPELNKVILPLNKVPSCEEQLTEIRKKYHDKYITFTNNKQVLPDHPFPKGTCLIVGDSMLARIDENRLKTGKHKVKNITSEITGLHHFAHWNNDALDNTSREILDKIYKLKMYIQKELPKCKITISRPVKWHDHISHLSKKFKDLSISIVDNSNIGAFYLNSGGLHLNDKGLGRLAEYS